MGGGERKKKKNRSLFVQKCELQCVVGRLGAAIAYTSTCSRFIWWNPLFLESWWQTCLFSLTSHQSKTRTLVQNSKSIHAPRCRFSNLLVQDKLKIRIILYVLIFLGSDYCFVINCVSTRKDHVTQINHSLTLLTMRITNIIMVLFLSLSLSFKFFFFFKRFFVRHYKMVYILLIFFYSTIGQYPINKKGAMWLWEA